MTVEIDIVWLTQLRVGDTVERWLAGEVPMLLKVTAIGDGMIYCGAWIFDRKTGGEIDEDLGWNGVDTGSFITKPRPATH